MKSLLFIVVLFVSGSVIAQNSYQVTLLRATPGRMLDLMEDLKVRAMDQNSNSSNPLIIRHSQGDHWDFFVIESIGDLTTHFSGQSYRVFSPSYGDSFYDLVAHHEQLYVNGPDPTIFNSMADQFEYFHIEMFVSLPGKQNELLKQREMENDYLVEIGRNKNLIFTTITGSAWDCLTLGGYRDIKHFAESADIPLDIEEKAAINAGFKGVTDISPYLRSLISRHNDTLGGKVAYLQESE